MPKSCVKYDAESAASAVSKAVPPHEVEAQKIFHTP